MTSLRRTLETSASESLYGGQFTLSTQLITPNDEGLTLETSASESLYGGQFTLSTQLIKPNYLVILPPTQHHSFFRNLPPLSYTIIRQLHGRANIYFLLTISRVFFGGKRTSWENKENSSCEQNVWAFSLKGKNQDSISSVLSSPVHVPSRKVPFPNSASSQAKLPLRSFEEYR